MPEDERLEWVDHIKLNRRWYEAKGIGDPP
jgi:hypothetical protein